MQKKNFAALFTIEKQVFIIPVKEAKNEEAVLERIEKAIQVLGE